MQLAPIATATLCNSVPASKDARAQRWQVRYPGVGPMEVLFTPPATQREVSAIYPGAEIDVLPESIRQDPSPSEATELRELVALMLADASDSDRAEALATAMNNPEAALESFRALVNQR